MINTNGLTFYILPILTIILAYLYVRIRKKLLFFESRNIPYIRPYFILGSFPKMLTLQEYWGNSWQRVYETLAGNKIGGFFIGLVPFLMVRDPDYINNIFSTDFSYFYDRSFNVDEHTNPLDGNLFFLKGSKWRALRNKLSPIFTSGKLKWMYDVMYSTGDLLLEHIDEVADGRDVDIKEQLGRFTTDVIGSCAFGIETEGLKNPDSKFRIMGKKFFEPSLWQALIFLLRFAAPDMMIKFKLKTTDREVNNFFVSAMTDVLDYRAKSGKCRKDFVQLLLELKQNGYVAADSAEGMNGIAESHLKGKKNDKFEITDPLLAAQSFVFFVAGFETTSATLHLTLYNLSRNNEAQEKAREEIIKIKEKHGGLSFDALKELTFLDKCIEETLRIFPPVPNINRECTKDYTFPDGTFIQKGTKIGIPIMAIQRDPQYFPDPLTYNPDRFEQQPRKGTYSPFGDGPRICIGKRFAQVEMKMILARLIEKYCFERSPLSESPLEPSPTSFVYLPKQGAYVRLKKVASL